MPGKSLPGDVELMLDVAADPVRRGAAITRLGADRREDLEPELRRLLQDHETIVREDAAAVLLVYWGRVDLLPEIADYLDIGSRTGPDAARWVELIEYRAALMEQLGLMAKFGLMANRLSGPDKARILEILIRQLGADDYPDVHRGAYIGLLEAMQIRGVAEWVTIDFAADRSVKWDRLAKALDDPQFNELLLSVRKRVEDRQAVIAAAGRRARKRFLRAARGPGRRVGPGRGEGGSRGGSDK